MLNGLFASGYNITGVTIIYTIQYHIIVLNMVGCKKAQYIIHISIFYATMLCLLVCIYIVSITSYIYNNTLELVQL